MKLSNISKSQAGACQALGSQAGAWEPAVAFGEKGHEMWLFRRAKQACNYASFAERNATVIALVSRSETRL